MIRTTIVVLACFALITREAFAETRSTLRADVNLGH
jgi:hypothetical protein